MTRSENIISENMWPCDDTATICDVYSEGAVMEGLKQAAWMGFLMGIGAENSLYYKGYKDQKDKFIELWNQQI